jgi:predicted nucleic acid-binding protein
VNILADTSIWVDHWRKGNPAFVERLADELVAIHPFVIGELALGRISPRHLVLTKLQKLPAATIVGHGEVLALIEHRDLAGSGLGWVDAHLLASALVDSTRLWTLDGPLARAAQRLGVGYRPN